MSEERKYRYQLDHVWGCMKGRVEVGDIVWDSKPPDTYTYEGESGVGGGGGAGPVLADRAGRKHHRRHVRLLPGGGGRGAA